MLPFDDCSPVLGMLTSEYRSVCVGEHERLGAGKSGSVDWSRPVPDETVEFLVVLFMLQMTALGRAMLVLLRDGSNYSGTANPCTALSRPMFEALVYLDYLLAEETSDRYVDFVVSDVASTHWVMERAIGQTKWSRRRSGRGEVPVTPCKCDSGLDKLNAQMDLYEGAWLSLRLLRSRPDTDPESLKRSSLAELRSAWVELGRDCRENTRELWMDCNRMWNRMNTHLFGMDVPDAITQGTLGSRFSSAPERVATFGSVENFLKWTGYVAQHPHTHLTGKRIGPRPEAARDQVETAISGAVWILLLGVDIVSRYAWATGLQEVAGNASLQMARSATLHPD